MKANELRIGNWVQTRADKNKFQVRDGEDIDDLGNTNTYEPIELSPEILEILNIEQIKSVSDLINIVTSPIETTIKENKDSVTATMSYGWSLSVTHTSKLIRSLHQLQNLYFALTGEELMIDEQELKRSVATGLNR